MKKSTPLYIYIKMNMIVSIVIFISLFAVASSFDSSTNKMAYTLSAAAYCPTKNYTTQSLPSPAESFKMLSIIDDSRSDTQGFVGVNIGTKQIFVVFRGSESIQDWFNDLDRVMTLYYNDKTTCTNCSVHAGLYKAYSLARSVIWTAMEAARSTYPSYEIVVTGHSLGAAVATFLSLEMYEYGISNRMFNYGSPRIGDTNFAIYASTKMTDHNRITHHKDMVPHTPLHYYFTHIDDEYYLEKTTLRDCNDSPGTEDETCSYQWQVTSIDDHMCYFDLYMDCLGIQNTVKCTSS